MKKIIWIVLFYFALAHFAFAQPPELNGKIKFVWGDEFNGSAINTDMWEVKDNNDNYGDGDGGVAIARNVWVRGGYLNCRVVRELYSCPDSPPDSNKVNENDCVRQFKKHIPYAYTYGRIDSKAKYNQQYGYAEAQMHFSYQPGLWPAFWTSVGAGIVPRFNAAEMDIMERLADSDAKTVTTNVHLAYCPEGATKYKCPNAVGTYCIEATGCYGATHRLVQEFWNATKYAVYWNPVEIVFYINDLEVRKMVNPGVADPVKFILGMGVSAADVTGNTELPSNLYVDYIHVYELTECLDKSTIGIGQTVVNNQGMQNIFIACTTVDGNGTSGGKLTLVGKNTVALLSPNFSVKEGGYLEPRISNSGKENTPEDPTTTPSKYYPLHMQGSISTEIVPEKVAVQEEMFTVSPNPISTTAFVKYTIAKQAPVKITLYNMMGTIQDELVNEHQSAGEHAYELDGSSYTAGVYLLVFESGGLKQKRTVVITK